MQLPAVFIEVLCLEPEGKKRADNVGNLVQLSLPRSPESTWGVSEIW